MSDQRTSSTIVDLSGVSKQWSRMIEDFEAEFAGGVAKLELAKSHPDVKTRFFDFLHVLADERAAMLPFEKRPAWKTIKIGTHYSKQDLQKAVEEEGYKLSDWAKEVVGNKGFTIETIERNLELFTATVAELGFKNGANVKDIYEKLDKLGFSKCPVETALQLRRVYKDQPMDEWRIVVSEPLADSGGGLRVLYVERNQGGSWVRSYFARPGSVWDGHCRLVFCRK